MSHHYYLLIYFLLCFLNCVTSKDSIYYCDKKTLFINLTNDQDTLIIKTRYENDTNYVDNVVCEWYIDTLLNYRLLIDQFNIDVQFVPDYASCNGFDYLDVYDYKNEKQDYLLSICRNDGFDIVLSSSNRLFLRFKSNYNMNKKGIEFRVKTWNTQTDCPPNWYRTTSDTCYLLYNQIVTLKKSQNLCNIAQSNLVLFSSENEINEILSNYNYSNNIQAQNIWISLNNIKNSNELRWVDGSVLKFKPEILDIENDENNYCFYMKMNNQTNYQFIRSPCYSNLFKLPFICTLPQKSSTELYTFPFDRENNNDEEDNLSVFLVIGVPIISVFLLLVVIVIVIVIVKYWNKIKCCKEKIKNNNSLQMTDLNNNNAPSITKM